MAYLVWIGIGLAVAAVFGASTRRRDYRPLAGGSYLGGAFGALIGGMLADALMGVGLRALTIASVLGAIIGALLFCWAMMPRTTDTEA
jgi:hypothetical protein